MASLDAGLTLQVPNPKLYILLLWSIPHMHIFLESKGLRRKGSGEKSGFPKGQLPSTPPRSPLFLAAKVLNKDSHVLLGTVLSKATHFGSVKIP